MLTAFAVLALVAATLSPSGIGATSILLFSLYAVTLPWNVIGMWNAIIGFALMRWSGDPLAVALPGSECVRDDDPISAKTAVLVCIRNEVPDDIIRNLTLLLSGLSDVRGRFDVFILSDTLDLAAAGVEEGRFRTLADEWKGRLAITYRRRTENLGYKAGNIRDFCHRWGQNYDFALTLDADSFMSANAVLRLVGIMQANEKLGILQSLVVGMPSTSAFARLFQFGMRLSMRSYTMGTTWWQADCGPYWGHNALIRLAPFIKHCHLPTLPANSMFGEHILSHDQIEGALMRRAGYEVRVVPVEHQSWEQNPATLLEFIRRDLRWCLGNMQYWHLLRLPDLQPVSRYQLAFAILMFAGSPAWIGLLLVGVLAAALAPSPAEVIDPEFGAALLAVTLAMWFAPKLATLLDVVSRPQELRSFGGLRRIFASVPLAAAFELLLAPIMWVGHTLFLLRLPFGRSVGWTAQIRNDHSVPIELACQALWPHTLLGVTAIALLAATHPQAIPYALFLAAGPALSIPLAVVTSWPSVGIALVRLGVGQIPEETDVPAALDALALPAIAARVSATSQLGHAS